MSEITPTSHGIIEVLRSIVAASSHLLSPAERDRITAEESARAFALLNIAADTAWQCAHREEIDSITRLEEAKRCQGEVAPVGGEQINHARKLEIIRAEADKVAEEAERLKVETLKIKAEVEKEISQKEKLVVEVQRVNAEIAICQLRLELHNKGWKG